MTAEELAKALSIEFNREYKASQIKAFRKNHKMPAGLDCRFKKGQTSWNKGKSIPCRGNSVLTTFKPGHTPHNTLPVGSVVTTPDGYNKIKLEDTGSYKDWKLLARYNWEKVNGTIPDGCVIVHLDGNRANDAVENLACITSAEHLMITRKKLFTSDPELNKTAVILAKTLCAVYKTKKELKDR